MSSLIRLYTSSLGRKYVMAVTGLLLGIFLLVHAVGNSTIFKGRHAFSTYAERLHSLGLLLPIAGLLLLFIFLLHIVTGMSLVLHNQKAKGKGYAITRSATGLRGWLARAMPYTGTAVFAFLLLHLGTIRFADQAVPVVDRVSRVLHDPLFASLYAAGITALSLHVSHGFWSLTQSLGGHHPHWNKAIQGCSYLLTILSALLFLGIIAMHSLPPF